MLKEGMKYDGLKVRYDLIPALAINLLAQLYTIGAWKYEADNWRKGLAWSRCYGALQRHANAFWAGEWADEQTGIPHLTCVMFCCCSLIESYYTHPLLDDRPGSPYPTSHEHLHRFMKFEFKQEEYETFMNKLKGQDDADQNKEKQT